MSWHISHNDAMTWKLSALLALCEGNPLVTVASPQRGPLLRRFAGFFLILSWVSCWTSSRVADNSIRHDTLLNVLANTIWYMGPGSNFSSMLLSDVIIYTNNVVRHFEYCRNIRVWSRMHCKNDIFVINSLCLRLSYPDKVHGSNMGPHEPCYQGICAAMDAHHIHLDNRTQRRLPNFKAIWAFKRVWDLIQTDPWIQWPLKLTHLPLVPHTGVSELGQHWFR